MRTFYVENYQSADDAAYTMHFTKHAHGGWIVMVNNTSTWLLYKDEWGIRDIDIKLLHGEYCWWTKEAIMEYWGETYVRS